jgi:hypothetical protein
VRYPERFSSIPINKTNQTKTQSHEKNHRFVKEKPRLKNFFPPLILTIVALQDQ